MFSVTNDYNDYWIVNALSGFACILCNYIFLFFNFSTNFSSDGLKSNNALPSFVYLAVLPALWIYVSTSSAQSTYTTHYTDGKSKPLAAIFVVNNIACFFSEKVKKIAILLGSFYLPCNSNREEPILNFLNAS